MLSDVDNGASIYAYKYQSALTALESTTVIVIVFSFLPKINGLVLINGLWNSITDCSFFNTKFPASMNLNVLAVWNVKKLSWGRASCSVSVKLLLITVVFEDVVLNKIFGAEFW